VAGGSADKPALLQFVDEPHWGGAQHDAALAFGVGGQCSRASAELTDRVTWSRA
jgi:hypothetical protein